MGKFDYAAAGVPARNDLQETHRWVWDHVQSPGTWWTGAERVAIAAETRKASACTLCLARKAALSPNAIQGEHDHEGKLSANVVDVIHRLVTDPARLSKPWFDSVIAGGLGETHYVELMGIATLVVGVDYFTRSLGIPPFPLPEPLAGEPARHRPAAAKPDGSWVPTVPSDAGESEGLYENSDFVANIQRALSLVPDQAWAQRRLVDAHYMPAGQVGDPSVRGNLDRMQMELVAGRVSALNECFY